MFDITTPTSNYTYMRNAKKKKKKKTLLVWKYKKYIKICKCIEKCESVSKIKIIYIYIYKERDLDG